MTARPPLETLEAASEESPASPSTGEGVEGDSKGSAISPTEQNEASISKTLEAILSKTDDDGESPLTAEEGAISFASARATTTDGTAGLGLHDQAEVGPSVAVDTMFDVDVDLATPDEERPKWSLPPPSDDKPVGALLDEVAEALKVQAAESRERHLGRASGTNVPERAPEVAKTPLVAKVAKSTEFEFEDPEDGPTTLNSSDEANGILAAASAVNRDDDEEAVVLGPASRRGDSSHPSSSLPGAGARPTLPAPPMPGSRTGNTLPHRVTPFAGLPAPSLPTFPAPASGRSRLPTPAPGHALGVTSPAGGRATTLPLGTPVAAATDAASPAALGLPDSSRRITRMSVPVAPLGATGRSDPSGGHHGLGLVGEPLSAALSSASTILKKDVRFRIASLAAIVLVTFVGGILIGRAAMRGKDLDAPPAVARAADPAAPPPAPAAEPAKAVAAPPPVAAVPVERPKIEAVPPPPTVAEAAPPGVAPMQFDQQPIRKRRARRAVPAPNEDPALVAPASKGPVRVASNGGPPPQTGKVTTAGKSAPKKKSAWHDPFAD